MKKIIIIGGGEHASVLKSILDMDTTLICLGYLDHGKTQLPLPYLGTDDMLKNYSQKDVLLVNGIGSIRKTIKRETVFNQCKQLGYCFHTVIHPKTIIAQNTIFSEGVQIMAGTIINPGTSLGSNVLINTGAILDHDCSIGAHTHIAPGAVLSGNISIGQGCHIGTGTTIIQGVRIGEYCTLGAGAVVLNNISAFSLAAGIPATTKRENI